MGQAGAQREPSMEEILASIRRIIENNEPADGAEDAAAMDAASDDAVESSSADLDARMEASSEQETAADHESGARDFVGDEAGAGMPDAKPTGTDEHEATASAVSPSDDDAAAPVSLADVAARVRGHSDQGSEQAAAPSHVPDRDAEAVIDDAIAEELRQALVSNDPVSAPQPSHDQAQLKGPETERDAAPQMTKAAQESALQSGAVNDPAPASTAVQVAAPVEAETDEARGQLVSLHTGEKVAAAFNELTAAIEAGQARSFDDIAQDMLRPMLTQWLDDNLPTLVERLVREEIERVSRGDRR
ncbi:DUF2497 domain-containing protein [uncultured Hoeflea sp.]|uniref:PopZ family protein n=1 Tax=uncultured Hoeflea sp. TaxID=538666 RepID=UPI0026194FD7|nr:DUF2497 domain-containing protein [uncultured Hoeflea sp.]